jgi:hypothetical protein
LPSLCFFRVRWPCTPAERQIRWENRVLLSMAFGRSLMLNAGANDTANAVGEGPARPTTRWPPVSAPRRPLGLAPRSSIQAGELGRPRASWARYSASAGSRATGERPRFRMGAPRPTGVAPQLLA